MDEYAGRVLAERYRLPLPPTGADALVDLVETRAFDTYSGQEVRIRQVPLPEIVDAELLGEGPAPTGPRGGGGATRRPAEPVARRAIEAAQAAAQIPDHPLLDQVFDVFAEAGSLWIVSEHVAARPLSALLAEGPLNPFRAAEIAADLLTALRVLHAHGWVHRNITARTVLVCDDGRVLLTGLAAGAAEEALCGYAPVPDPEDPPFPAPEPEYGGPGPYGETEGTEGAGDAGDHEDYGDHEEREEYEEYGATGEYEEPGNQEAYEPAAHHEPYEAYEPAAHHEPYEPAARHEAYGTGEHATGAYGTEVYETGEYAAPEGVAALPAAPEPAAEPGPPEDPEPVPYGVDPYGRAAPQRPASPPEAPAVPPSADLRAARAGAIAAYRAATRAAAARRGDTGPLPDRRPAVPGPTPAPEPRPAPDSPSAPRAVPVPWPEPPSPAPPGAVAEPGPAGPAPPGGTRPGPAPQWWARTGDDAADEADEDEEDEEGDERPPGGPRPPRLMLKGTWSDGPHASRDDAPRVPAGGGSVLPGSGRPALPAGYTAAPVPARRVPSPAEAAVPAQPGPAAERYRGPATRLDAERARQTRIAVVGAVTERWAPEQAGPVHENWRLAPPIGPATDLWALGALLYRAVQGHAPYPEDSAAELVQLVCAEPPAFAEECGPLRPVVESLLRQDPTERPDFEELRGWLRSLVRSAPEPEPDLAAAPPSRFDPRRLPILRRRGELVRRRRAAAASGRHRHRRGKEPRPERTAPPAPAPEPPSRPFPAYEDDGAGDRYGPSRETPFGQDEPVRGTPFDSRERYEPQRETPSESRERYEPVREAPFETHERYGSRQAYEYGHEDAEPEPRRRGPRPQAAPRSLGRRLLLFVLLLLGGALAYAAVALPRDGGKPADAGPPAAPTKAASPATTPPAPAPTTAPPATTPAAPRTPPTSAPPASGPAPAAGYVLREDPEGFRIGVPRDWRRSSVNDAGQVRYTGGDFTLIVVPGRDSVRDHGSDPLEYQSSRERELEPYRQSSWSQLVRARRVDIGRTPTAEGQYTWMDGTGREVFVHNLALIEDGRYYVVQVIGPESEREKVTEVYEEAVKGFRAGR
ncbi:protein kinase [Streptomyces omiyaensis]|uniref:Protein kinase n=1 Tax=Streptomyces omiyaensis TaxID=68247 RepID=A0ABW7BN21_9ACTN